MTPVTPAQFFAILVFAAVFLSINFGFWLWSNRRRHDRLTLAVEDQTPDDLMAVADAVAEPVCQGADFSRLLTHLQSELEAHADRDGMYPARRAVFLARGGHAPGEVCPSEPPAVADPHEYWCASPDDECDCGAIDPKPTLREQRIVVPEVTA